MGAKACKKSKVRQPKRDEAKELAEKEKNERELKEKEEAEAEALRQAQEEAARLAAEAEQEEARKREEEEEAARLAEEARQKEEEERLEAERKAAEEAEARRSEEEKIVEPKVEEEKKSVTPSRIKTPPRSPQPASPRGAAPAAPAPAEAPKEAPKEAPVQQVPETVPQDDETARMEQPVSPGAGEKDETASEATMSTQATGAVQKTPKGRVSDTAQGATPRTVRSIGNCDMTPVDKTAKNLSRMCGCDLGDDHDENKCPICKNMDLSDAPLLN